MKTYYNFNLQPYHSFGMDVRADEVVILESVEEIEGFVKGRGDGMFILGGGSNVLFTGDFHGVIVKIDMKGIGILDEQKDKVMIQAAAGENWDGFVGFCVKTKPNVDGSGTNVGTTYDVVPELASITPNVPGGYVPGGKLLITTLHIVIGQLAL